MKPHIAQEELKELLDYNPETGIFTWKVDRSRSCRKGSIAGCLCADGYIQINIKGKMYRANRLAWLISNGYLPSDKVIDHINRVKSDNKLSNLRCVTHSENSLNKGVLSNNTSGEPCIRKRNSKWEVQLERGGKYYYIGIFNSIDEARLARDSIDTKTTATSSRLRSKSNLSLDILHTYLNYNPLTGVFTWKVNKSASARKGSTAGTLNERGYVTITINGNRQLAHRLAWFISAGKLPNGIIDHIDGNPGNNSLCNLRIVTNRENVKNSKLRKNNTSGYTGVYTTRREGVWRACIKNINGKQLSLGSFKEKSDAVEAYRKASIELYPEINGGLR